MDFYTQAGIWWGADPHDDPRDHSARAATLARLRGPGPWRVLDLGAGSGFTAAALADAGHAVVGVELNPTDIGYAQVLLALPRADARWSTCTTAPRRRGTRGGDAPGSA